MNANSLSEWLLAKTPTKNVPRWVDLVLQRSTWKARRKLMGKPWVLLVDNDIFHLALTHVPKEIDVVVPWPSPESQGTVPMVHRVRRQWPSSEHQSFARYLPGLAQLACEGFLDFRVSYELLSERINFTKNLWGPFRWEFSLMGGLEKLESVNGVPLPHGPLVANSDPPDFESPGEPELRVFEDPETRELTVSGVVSVGDRDPFGLYPNNAEIQNSRMKHYGESGFTKLAGIFLDENIKDFRHIWVAKKYEMDGFLSADVKLHRKLKAHQGHRKVRDLGIPVYSPETLGRALGVEPVNPYVCELGCEDSVFSSLNQGPITNF